jgi:hypothetical protein
MVLTTRPETGTWFVCCYKYLYSLVRNCFVVWIFFLVFLLLVVVYMRGIEKLVQYLEYLVLQVAVNLLKYQEIWIKKRGNYNSVLSFKISEKKYNDLLY